MTKRVYKMIWVVFFAEGAFIAFMVISLIAGQISYMIFLGFLAVIVLLGWNSFLQVVMLQELKNNRQPLQAPLKRLNE